MRANFDRLVEGAAGAARVARDSMREAQPGLAVLISCVGRKLVLKQRVEEEVEEVREVLGNGHRAHRLLFLRRDLALHAHSPLRAAQPDHDHHHPQRGA